ncbi:MAG: hypothetical protein U9N34_05030 [Candidatus Cloacimonadota bacterium]|nr:hypothetical protein [Candidatus Cloacimonadota bacterium]
MRCKKCREKVDENEIYCHNCGQATELLDNELSAKKNFIKNLKYYKENFSKYLLLSSFWVFTQFFPLILALVWFHYNPISENIFIKYLINNIIILVIIPNMLVSFSAINNNDLSIKGYFTHYDIYPKMFLFTLVNVLYYAFIRLICTGDPILNIVWLILSIYWVAINIPTIYLLINRDLSVFKAIKLSYQAGKETRWQQFFLAFYLFLLNGLGFVVLGVGMIFTVPLIYIVILNYGEQIDRLSLFENIQ